MSSKNEISQKSSISNLTPNNSNELLNMSRSELIADFSENTEIISDVDSVELRTAILESKSEFVKLPLELPGESQNLLTTSFREKKNFEGNDNIFKSNFEMKTNTQFQNFEKNENFRNFEQNLKNENLQNFENLQKLLKNENLQNGSENKNEMLEYYKNLYSEEKSKNKIFTTKLSEINTKYLNSIEINHKSEKTYQIEILELKNRINQLEGENSNLMQKLDIDTIRDQNEFKRDLEMKESYLKEIQGKIIKFQSMIENKNDVIENLNKEIYDIKNKENDTLSQFEINLHKVKISLENCEIRLGNEKKRNAGYEEDLDLGKKIINELKNELIKAKEFNYQLEANLEYNKQLIGNLQIQNKILLKEKEKILSFSNKRNLEMGDLERSLKENLKFEQKKIESEIFRKNERIFEESKNFFDKKKNEMNDFLEKEKKFGEKKNFGNNFEETGPMNPFKSREEDFSEKRDFKRKRANLKKKMEMRKNGFRGEKNVGGGSRRDFERGEEFDEFGRRKYDNSGQNLQNS